MQVDFCLHGHETPRDIYSKYIYFYLSLRNKPILKKEFMTVSFLRSFCFLIR